MDLCSHPGTSSPGCMDGYRQIFQFFESSFLICLTGIVIPHLQVCWEDQII